MECHQTATCPHCGSDSWRSAWEATFSPVKCMWCDGKFMYQPLNGSIKYEDIKKDKK